jgi:hypothetical protein
MEQLGAAGHIEGHVALFVGSTKGQKYPNAQPGPVPSEISTNDQQSGFNAPHVGDQNQNIFWFHESLPETAFCSSSIPQFRGETGETYCNIYANTVSVIRMMKEKEYRRTSASPQRSWSSERGYITHALRVVGLSN